MTTHHRHKPFSLLALLVLALSCQSNAFSLPSLTPKHALRRKEPTKAPGRIFDNRRQGDHHAIQASLTGSLSGGGEQESLVTNVLSFVQKNFLLVGMIVAVSFARLYPALGKNGGLLRPELFIGKFGVAFIFLLSGLSLEISELKEAFSNIKLNTAIQLSTFAAWPFLVGLPFTRAMRKFLPNVLSPPLLDGLLILTCLPTTVNMCVILTSSADGNVASALCNAVISNVAGIFLTPALLLRFFGTEVQLPFLAMVWKLCNMVLLPVAIGQALRRTKAKDIYKAHSKKFKKAQELIMLSIIWNAFCNAFSVGWRLQFSHAMTLLLILPTLHLGSLFMSFKIFEKSGSLRGEVVAAMFCASQKTLAFGLPLVNTIFEGSPNLAAYCAPLMLVHPLQMVLGSLLIPRLAKYTAGEAEKVK